MKSATCKWTICVFLFLHTVLSSLPVVGAVREELSLNGSWQAVKVPSLDVPVPAEGWKEIEVPGVLQGHNYERAWYRRSFTVPHVWNGKRILIRFGGVKFNSRVLVNGTEVGGCYNGYDPFELDITETIRYGENNDLLVGVHDWTALFTGEKVDFGGLEEWMALRAIPRDRILSPIGGRFDLYGIWDDVILLAVPPVHIEDLFVRSSIRQNRLAIDVVVLNTGPNRFQGAVEARIYAYDGSPRDTVGAWPVGGDALTAADPVTVTLSSGQKTTVAMELDDPPLDQWWPHDPRLYILELRVDGHDGDCVRERFGFREFWTEDGDFYLNGVKIHLLARSWWPSENPLPREDIEDRVRMLKQMNVTCFRTHTQPWPRRWYEIADELGLLMIPEGAVFNDDEVYRVLDSRFWDTYARHLQAMVRSLRNHPSVIMWSLENEFHGIRARDNTPVERELVRLGRMVKTMDPTRPIIFESDGDPGGSADVIGMHYPNEYPERRRWPNDAFWMDQPNASRADHMFWDEPHFLWDRHKPLYIGEFLWVPNAGPSTATVFFGDEVYKAPRQYHYLAKAQSWRMQIHAYRRYEVSGISPWGYDFLKPDDDRKVVLLAQRDMFRPLAAFIREYDSRFFSGETVDRTVDLFNDTMSDHPEAQLDWRLLEGDRVAATGIQTLNLRAGSHKETILHIPMPDVQQRTSFSLLLTLHSKGKEQFREEWPIDMFPRKRHWSLPDVPLFLYDPERKLQTAWQKAGVEFYLLDTVDTWQGNGVLIIGAGLSSDGQEAAAPTTVIGSASETLDVLSDKVQAGGRVLALAQTPQTADCIPVQLTTLSSTMAFAQMPNHPILSTFQPGDFRWWRGDHIVSRYEPARPRRGAARPLVVTGTEQGISHAPLLEIPQGKGVWLICQLLVVSKLDVEPVAQTLLEQMIHYLGDYHDPQGETICYGSPDLIEHLNQLDLRFRTLDDWSTLTWPQVRLLVLQADGVTIDGYGSELNAFLEAGGTVLLHRPQLDEFPHIRRALNLPFDMQTFRGAVVRAEGGGSFVEGLTREDLYWLEPQSVPNKSTIPRNNDMADGVFVPALDNLDTAEGRHFEAEQNVQLAGPFVKVENEEIVFGSEGTANWRISIPETGRYVLGLMAHGTPCNGVYPTAEITLNGQPAGILNINSRTQRFFALELSAERGAVDLKVAFINDARSATEDRNLFLDKLVLAPCAEDTLMTAITVPPALVHVPIGKGSLILSAIKWDESGGSALRANRFVVSLLHTLGARFGKQNPVTILEAETLDPNPDMSAFYPAQDHVLFGANGYVGTKVMIARPGTYRVVLWAKGTAVGGVYPIVSIQLDGIELGQVECSSNSWGPHELLVDLPAGDNTLRFAFINDLRRETEDRNLWLDRIELERLN